MTKDIITNQIEFLKSVKKELSKFDSKKVNADKIFEYARIIEIFQMALMYVYDNILDYGKYSDFIAKEDSSKVYDLFCYSVIKNKNPKEAVDNLMSTWNSAEAILLSACKDKNSPVVKDIIISLNLLKSHVK